MKKICAIKNEIFNCNRRMSVGIIDSGFSTIPDYATLHGKNFPDAKHGNRILALFTNPDDTLGKNIDLHLSCFQESSGYNGLINALSSMPPCDILSISLAWKDDMEAIRSMMEEKFMVVVAADSSKSVTPYPAKYPGVIKCSDGTRYDEDTDYVIKPPVSWRGNSYAAPMVSRILAACGSIDTMDELIVDNAEIQEGFPVGCTPVDKMFMMEQRQKIAVCKLCGRKIKPSRINSDGDIVSLCPKCGGIID